MKWTAQEDVRLADLWVDKGFSSSRLAAIFNRSRGSVMSAVNRLGLMGKGKRKGTPRGKNAVPRPARPAPVKILTEPVEQIEGLKEVIERINPPEPPPSKFRQRHARRIDPPLGELVCGPVTLANRRECQCSWPIGDPFKPDFRYCGAMRALPSSYCEEHRKLGSGPGTVAERRVLNAPSKRSNLTETFT